MYEYRKTFIKRRVPNNRRVCNKRRGFEARSNKRRVSIKRRVSNKCPGLLEIQSCQSASHTSYVITTPKP